MAFPRRPGLYLVTVILLASLLISCGATPTATPPPAPTAPLKPAASAANPTVAPASNPNVLRLATTTSTADTGLLDAILPAFEKATNSKVDVVAVGTGQAIEIGRKGDADVLLVHARAQEDQFVKDGEARERYDVMYNDFVLVGPKEDPAKVIGMTTAAEAFKAIAGKQAVFVSRGDKSGTNTKELQIWASAGITPTKEMTWYNAIGQGMGDTLVFTNEKKGYTLSDRGTYAAMASKITNATIVVGGANLAENKDKALLNPYGVMAVNPDKHPGINYNLATKFITWILSADTQRTISGYGVDKYKQPLFYSQADSTKPVK